MPTQFPYPMNLTQLEAILPGFKFTELEQRVVGNPKFQHLKQVGLPDWGELTTGLKHGLDSERHSRFTRSPQNDEVVLPLSPSAVGKLADDLVADLRAVYVLTATVSRDAKPQDNHDEGLVQDLCVWLSGGKPSRGFRWERHYASLLDKAREQEWSAQAAELKQGTSDVIVLLTDSFPPSQQQNQRDRILDNCRTIHNLTDKFSWNWARYAPRADCQDCSRGRVGRQSEHNRDCQNNPVLIVVDSGNVSTVKGWLSSNLKREIKSVRFKVPRSTFRDGGSSHAQIYPSLAIFTVDQLVQPGKEEVLRCLTKWVSLKRQEEKGRSEWSEYKSTRWERTQVITPAGTSKLNAILVAGPVIDWNLNWMEAFRDSDWVELVENGMTISFTKS